MPKIVAGNWKMFGTPAMAKALAADIVACSRGISGVEIVVCPPAVLLGEVKAALAGSSIKLGSQDCHHEPEGAYTGDVSAPMLRSMGCSYVICGHSERRQFHHESNEEVRKKTASAITNGLKPIVCVGESLTERRAGKAEAVVEKQLKESLPAKAGSGDFVLAYEPVWAIGSGQTPTVDDIRRMHGAIGAIVPGVSVLYGGSVKAANAREILSVEGVSGVLVGGASLKAGEFCKIIEAAT